MSSPILSKALLPGQWRAFGRASIGAACLLLGAIAPLPALAGAPAVQAPEQPSYAALKAAPVNARIGPGEDYKALWTFQAKGVPVQIVEQSDDWRRVCDPEGGLAWVRARALDSRRRVMRTAKTDLPIRRNPAVEARIVAVLAAHATAQLMTCKAGWCRITVDHATGWVRQGDVWGAADGPQCR